MEMSCRLCAGIADPGVCLMDPAHQRLAACAQNNLNITIAADNDYPTQICTSCADGLRRWMMFRERAEKAHGKFQKTLKPPSDVTVAPFLPQSGGEASPDTCSVAVRTGTAEQTSRQPSQAMENIGPEIRPARTFLDKWLRPSQTLKLPVVTKSSTNRAVRTNSSQENLVAKFCLKDLRVCVARLSEKLLASLQQAKAGPAAGQKKVGCSLPQATETASPKSASVTSTRSVGDAATNQQTSSCGQELSDSSSAARKAVCGGGQLTVEGTSLLSLPDTDGDTRADVQSTARPGLLPARHKTPRRSPGDEEDDFVKKVIAHSTRDCSYRPDTQNVTQDRPDGKASKTGQCGGNCTSDIRTCELCPPNANQKCNHVDKFLCVECGQKFSKRFRLAYHINIHHKWSLGIYKCEFCDSSFNLWKDMFNHKKNKHTNMKSKKYLCNLCDKGFKFPSILLDHFERKHGNISYNCELCGESFKSKWRICNHVKTVHFKSKILKHNCHECGKKFRTKYQLIDHIQRHHNTGQCFQCDQCKYKTKSEKDLKTHKKCVHSEKVLKYICNVCDKRFYSKSNLREHVDRFHTNDSRKYLCNLCPVSSKTAGDLRTHKRVVHSKKMFTCKKCNVTLKSKQYLNRHMNRVHVENLQSFECDICNAKFNLEIYLNKHKMNIHTDKRYKCGHCEKMFATKGDLVRHTIYKHGDGSKPFKCTLCSYACKLKTNLTHHMKRRDHIM